MAYTPIQAGASTGIGGASCTLSMQTGSVGTPATLVETTLFTYTLPANAFDGTSVKALRVKAFGTMANNAHVKTLTLYLGSASLATLLTPSIDGSWVCDAVFVGTASAQYGTAGVSMIDNGSSTPLIFMVAGPATEDGTAPIIIKVTGLNGTATANDIVAKAFIVELLSTPA